jgi:hypothetical protein
MVSACAAPSSQRQRATGTAAHTTAAAASRMARWTGARTTAITHAAHANHAIDHAPSTSGAAITVAASRIARRQWAGANAQARLAAMTAAWITGTGAQARRSAEGARSRRSSASSSTRNAASSAAATNARPACDGNRNAW